MQSANNLAVTNPTKREIMAMYVLEAPGDETMSAFTLKIGSMGSVKTHTMRAFPKDEMEKILAKIK